MNYKGILFFLGINSLIVSFFSILNILYSFYFNFILDINSYLICFFTTLLLGLLFCFVGYKFNKNISINDQILLFILTFVFIPLFLSLPYYFSIYNLNFLNSYFESVSGFTATGFSTIKNVNNIDEPLLLWRSSSQWLGGLLFIIATIGTLSSKQIKINPAYLMTSSDTISNFYSNFNYNFIKVLLIYFFSTILIIFLYSLFDLRLFDSFNLAFTIISSGGFIPSNFLSDIIKTDTQILILSLTLLFPIFNFYLLFKIFSNKFKFKEHQEDLHLSIMIIFLTLSLYFFIIPNKNLLDIFLGVVSSVSTSGISNYFSSSVDMSLFFILLTIIGGSLISASSGFKYVRFYILLKISYNEIYKLVKPINIFNKNLFNSESKIEDLDSKITFLIFVLFIISIFVLSSILTFDDMTFENAFKLSILTLTNTVTSSLYGLDNLSFFDLNIMSKMSLIVFMILGKIELIAVLYLIKKFIFRE